MKDLIKTLRPPQTVEGFMANHDQWVKTRSHQLKVLARFITAQTLLHLPYYNQDTIVNASEEVLGEIDEKIINLSTSHREAYSRLVHQSNLPIVSSEAILKGKNSLSAHDESSTVPVTFAESPSHIANDINENLHYIRSTRKDSLIDYGLFINGSETPYANASFSRCTRQYQVKALNEAALLNLSPSEILSMTRAFAFNGAPKNSMSKLFHQASRQIKQDFPEIKAIITALNPYLGFDGGVFTGASYTPYALSPMEYWYDEAGYYVPRSKGIHPQSLDTPPIIWLAHGLDKEISQKIASIPISKLRNITVDEYKKG